jgi:hypothetical protein
LKFGSRNPGGAGVAGTVADSGQLMRNAICHQIVPYGLGPTAAQLLIIVGSPEPVGMAADLE